MPDASTVAARDLQRHDVITGIHADPTLPVKVDRVTVRCCPVVEVDVRYSWLAQDGERRFNRVYVDADATYVLIARAAGAAT